MPFYSTGLILHGTKRLSILYAKWYHGKEKTPPDKIKFKSIIKRRRARTVLTIPEAKLEARTSFASCLCG